MYFGMRRRTEQRGNRHLTKVIPDKQIDALIGIFDALTFKLLVMVHAVNKSILNSYFNTLDFQVFGVFITGNKRERNEEIKNDMGKKLKWSLFYR